MADLRVFARVHGAFDVECPACGTVTIVPYTAIGRRRDQSTSARVKVRKIIWDPLRSVFTCPSCRVPWIVGLNLTRKLPYGTPQEGMPSDQVLSAEQVEQLRDRQQTGGRVSPTGSALGRRTQSNHTEPCRCPTWESGSLAGMRKGLDPACQRHGKGGSAPDPGQE